MQAEGGALGLALGVSERRLSVCKEQNHQEAIEASNTTVENTNQDLIMDHGSLDSAVCIDDVLMYRARPNLEMCAVVKNIAAGASTAS